MGIFTDALTRHIKANTNLNMVNILYEQVAAMGFISLISSIAVSAAVVQAGTKGVTCPDGKNTASNAACCPFFALRDDLQANL